MDHPKQESGVLSPINPPKPSKIYLKMMMKISVVLAQFPVSLSIQENLKAILAALDQAQPGDIVLFPEGSISGYAQDFAFLQAIDPQVLTAAVDQLRDQAQKRGVHIWAGACFPDGGQWFNVALGFTPAGGAHQYRKVNLATHERGVITAGSDLPVFELETPVGPVKVGVQICRELRYPEQWGWLARQGAQVFLHLNNAVDDPLFLPVWRSHLVSHAAANQRFLISANNAAIQQTSPTIAIGPHGRIMAEILSDQAMYTRVELDLSQVSTWYLDQSRPDVVSLEPPTQKERRRILRSMKMEKLQKDFDELQANPGLYEETNLTARTEALEFINMIEDMHRLRSRDRELQHLYQQAADLRQRIEEINAQLFTLLRERILTGRVSSQELRESFEAYSEYNSERPGQPHYGYDNLDGLITGLFLAKPPPEETLERKPGMVRYQPTPASVVLELIDQVGFKTEDIFYDLGSGLGMVIGLVNLLTGVRSVGVEYQPAYWTYATQMVKDLNLKNISFINTDAQEVDYTGGTVFFMFNPFGGRIFDTVLDQLQAVSRRSAIRICSYGSCTEPISRLPWLEIQEPDTLHDFKLAIFRSKKHQG
jgi:predicted amidohydrolase